MKLKLLFLLLLGFSAFGLQRVESQPLADDRKSGIENPKAKVLVELFTSEGCSNCPPADRALAFLQKEQPHSQAEIITLAFHVDYWNGLGWKDEFSSPLFTQRQQFYAQKFRLDSAYTPQMVVDGSFELVGSDLGKVQKAISATIKTAKAKIYLSARENKLKVDISDATSTSDATVYLAIAEDNLASSVQRGENAGNRLEHISVVRELKMLGKIEKGKTEFATETLVELNPAWKRENVKLVVFVQENQSRRVLGVHFIAIDNKG
jgi:hypothetical protein